MSTLSPTVKARNFYAGKHVRMTERVSPPKRRTSDFALGIRENTRMTVTAR